MRSSFPWNPLPESIPSILLGILLYSAFRKKSYVRKREQVEGVEISAFHPPILPPDVIAGEVDVFPAEGRQVFKQVVADRQNRVLSGPESRGLNKPYSKE